MDSPCLLKWVPGGSFLLHVLAVELGYDEENKSGWDVAEEWSAESVHFSGWSGTRLNARRGWVAAYGGSGLRNAGSVLFGVRDLMMSKQKGKRRRRSNEVKKKKF